MARNVRGAGLDTRGFAPFGDLYRINKQLRDFRANEEDVVTIMGNRGKDAKRIDGRRAGAKLTVRTFQDHSASSPADVTIGPENELLPTPGYLIHSTGVRTMRGTLSGGLRKMYRNATQSIPAEFNTRQSLYSAAEDSVIRSFGWQ